MALFLKPRRPGSPPAVLEGTAIDAGLIRVSQPAEMAAEHRVIHETYVRPLPDAAGPARILTDEEYSALAKSLEAPAKPAPATAPATPSPTPAPPPA